MTYKDMTFCASTTCQGRCGRKLTVKDNQYLAKNTWERVSYSEFCDIDGNPKNMTLKRAEFNDKKIQDKDN